MRTVLKLGYTEAVAHELVHAGLWCGHHGGFLFHQWSEHQLTKAEVEKKRSKWTAVKKAQRSAESQRKSSMSSVDTVMDSIVDSTLVSTGPSPSPLFKKESVAPVGAPAPKPAAKKREKPKAQQALEAALADAARTRRDVAPALSNSLAQKAAKRITEYAEASGLSLAESAKLLADAWFDRGNGNVWKLNDLSFATAQRSTFPLPLTSLIREGA